MIVYNWVFGVQVGCLTYVMISAPLYAFVISAVIYYRKKEPHLKNSFFRVWISLGLADLCHATVFWFSSKIPLMGFFSSFFLNVGQGFARFIQCVMFTTHFAQVLGILLLSINRLTALIYPTKSEAFWTRPRVVPCFVGALWSLSFLLSTPVGFMEQNWIQVHNQSKVEFHFLSINLAAPYMFYVGILLATITVATVGSYIFMFYKVQKMSVEQKKALKTQLKLALCGFLVAAFLALLSVCFCLFSFYTETIMFGDNAILFFVSCDLNTFCNVYLLLSTSKIVRGRVSMLALKIFCGRSEERAAVNGTMTRKTTRLATANRVSPCQTQH